MTVVYNVVTTLHKIMQFILLLCHSQLIIDHYVCVGGCVVKPVLELLLFLHDAQRVEIQEVDVETTNEYSAMVGLPLIIKEDSVLDMM